MVGQQTPNVHCLFLFKWYIHLFILNSARGSEMNGGRQTPNVHCLFLYRWVISMCILHAISDAIAAARSMQQWIVSLTFRMSISSTHNLVGQIRAMELFEEAILRH